MEGELFILAQDRREVFRLDKVTSLLTQNTVNHNTFETTRSELLARVAYGERSSIAVIGGWRDASRAQQVMLDIVDWANNSSKTCIYKVPKDEVDEKAEVNKREVWREAYDGCAIVSNQPTKWDDPENVKAYGGYMVCESVDPRCKPLLLAALQMLKTLQRMEWTPLIIGQTLDVATSPQLFACPRCFRTKDKGHRPDCELAAALEAAGSA